MLQNKNVSGRGLKRRLLRFKKAFVMKNREKRNLLVFFAFGMGLLGIFFWFSLERGFLIAEAENGQPIVNADMERCRWRKDVELFIILGNEGRLPVTEKAPCEFIEQKKATDKISAKDVEVEKTIRELTVGYPLEVMAPAIAKYDREIAALIVGIAKKESNWGKRSPRDKAGSDCFNYWGYKGAGTRGIEMGHGCFGSPEEAVKAIGDRLAELVQLRETSDPKHLTVWKCGSSCKTHSPESVRKWIQDVDLYYQKIAKK